MCAYVWISRIDLWRAIVISWSWAETLLVIAKYTMISWCLAVMTIPSHKLQSCISYRYHHRCRNFFDLKPFENFCTRARNWIMLGKISLQNDSPHNYFVISLAKVFSSNDQLMFAIRRRSAFPPQTKITSFWDHKHKIFIRDIIGHFQSRDHESYWGTQTTVIIARISVLGISLDRIEK